MITIKATSQMSRAELIAALEQANVGARKQAEAMTELGKLTDMQMKRIAALEKALNDIAAWNDTPANERLASFGSYLAFDEPGAVEMARAALAAQEPKP